MSGTPDRPSGDYGFVLDGSVDVSAAMLRTRRQAVEDVELCAVELGQLDLKVVVRGVFFSRVGREDEERSLGQNARPAFDISFGEEAQPFGEGETQLEERVVDWCDVRVRMVHA